VQKRRLAVSKAAGSLTSIRRENTIVSFGFWKNSRGAPLPAINDAIAVIGARVHNLKNIDVQIPVSSLSVITGVSGSGKSSLAFDTLYAEGQRRYVASLSAYARQFLERIDRPDVDDILGICPALAIRQKNSTRNPRSTVGTVTEINDYLRLLYARIGITRCRRCGRAVETDNPEKIADCLMVLPPGARLYLCFRLALDKADSGESNGASGRRGSRASQRLDENLALALPGLQQQGFVRLLIGGRVVDLADAVDAFRAAAVKEAHVVVDRLVIQDDVRKRLLDSLEICGRESEGRIEVLLLAEDVAAAEQLLQCSLPNVRWLRHPAGILLKFSERFECQLCHIVYQPPEPRLFSFNNSFGACPECQGFGNTMTLDMDLVIPDKSKSLHEGAVAPWRRPRYRSFQARLLQFAERAHIDVHVPWHALPEEHQNWVIAGRKGFPGILGFFEYLERKKYKMHVRILISRYRGYATCPKCQGERLRPEARDVFVAGRRISEVTRMTVRDAAEFFSRLELSPQEEAIAAKILHEVRHRLDLLLRVGLNYLTLDRLSSSLSGGESQRIQLAAALGSTLVGALYVLDEPSIGLHPRDSARLVQILNSLRDLGNTVLVVEHDPEIMNSADYIIDLGPRAGEHGGSVVFQGRGEDLRGNPDSLTGRYLAGELEIPAPRFRRKPGRHALEVINARKHNLQNLQLRVPLEVFVCISGVSGSGKSTLVHDVLYNGIKAAKGHGHGADDAYDAVNGAEHVSDVILVDQSPIGRTPRSNPATYIKAFDEIRAIFAETRDAYARNLGAGHFSFNLAGGRCETCQGNGTVTVEMQFLADVELTCDDCKGTRYKSVVLEVRYKGKNIAEVLQLTVHEAMTFFAGHSRLLRKLRVLEEIGLAYLRLGQSATALSGGEAQRIKLAAFIGRKSAAKALYIFDEPTTGLHFDDIRKLLAAFDKLVAAGNSVLVIEHNLDVIKSADWVIDLGPEGGDCGGQVVFEGPPHEIIHCAASYTGQYLRKLSD
jgi:excinuclease ABC subunit A